MEVTGIALQTVAAGEDVAFTETAVNGTKCIVHRQGSGIIKLRGITNQCKARFLVSYSGNIQIPTGGTVEAISLAIAVDGEPLQSTKMIVTPAAVENFFNVSAQAYVDVPCVCCIMDKISELLQYVHRTNTEMTREKLIEELSKSDYAARSLIFTKENFQK